MTLFLTIIAFVVIFSVLVLIHEFGHYIVAKKAGIKVEEFGFGIPPKIWGFKPKKSETQFTLNLIPFGGFVRLYGEDSHDPKVLKSSRSFASKSTPVKLAVVAAGVVMNFILAFVLLTLGFIFGMQPLLLTPEDFFWLEEIAIGAARMAGRGGHGRAAQHELVAHELAVVFADGALRSDKAGVAEIGRRCPLPHRSEHLGQTRA